MLPDQPQLQGSAEQVRAEMGPARAGCHSPSAVFLFTRDDYELETGS
jgi:hypothetical protein